MGSFAILRVDLHHLIAASELHLGTIGSPSSKVLHCGMTIDRRYGQMTETAHNS
ncbi:hypothetical protein CDL15_Pgr007400 [Punica granatum]|uniref:Uncharacterized protein n=1 Tax=Punica granatum TaxID=22663 RepID=A0A218XAI8_PUNGR|nr:hypothetical protein CDL15_Pgr007400 [Punica granatum]